MQHRRCDVTQTAALLDPGFPAAVDQRYRVQCVRGMRLSGVRVAHLLDVAMVGGNDHLAVALIDRFDHLAEQDIDGFWIVLGACGLIAVALSSWFARRHWLKDR